MRACAACGQPVPIRWRNTDGPPRELQHTAGAVLTFREPPSQGYPWGRIVDRHQNCSDCATQLVRGPWALLYDPGTPVIEHGVGAPSPIMIPGQRPALESCRRLIAPNP